MPSSTTSPNRPSARPTVAVILVLINRPALLGKHRAGFLLNAGLILALLFSCIIAVTGALALFRQFTEAA